MTTITSCAESHGPDNGTACAQDLERIQSASQQGCGKDRAFSKTANDIVGPQQAFGRRSEAKQHVAEIVLGACQLQPRVSGNADLQV